VIRIDIWWIGWKTEHTQVRPEYIFSSEIFKRRSFTLKVEIKLIKYQLFILFANIFHNVDKIKVSRVVNPAIFAWNVT